MFNKLGSQQSYGSVFNVESLESRLLMAAPTFVTEPADFIFDANGGAVMPINGDDADGDSLTITAVSDNPNFTVTVPTGDRFARIYFKAPQIWASTVTSFASGQTFTLSVVNGATSQDITYTATLADSTATVVATKLATAWNNASNPLSTSIVATTSGAKIYLYQKTAGQTFTVDTPGTGSFSGSSVVQATFSGSVLVQLFTTNPLDAAAAQRFIDLSTNHVSANGTLDQTGSPYYTDVKVHRIIDGFMMQTGDATNNNGTGNSPLPNLKDKFDHTMGFGAAGLLAMANTGAGDSSNSQWFITDGPTSSLDGKYIIFGQMIDDGGIFNKIMTTPVLDNGQGETSKPMAGPILDHVEVLAASDADAHQAGSIFVVPKDGYVGTGNMTITLSDGVNSIQKTVVVKACGLGEIADVRLAPGAQTTVDLPFYVDSRSKTITVASKGLSSATVTFDATTNKITIKVPDTFEGAFPVTMSMAMDPNILTTGGENTVTRTFYVVSEKAGIGPTYTNSFQDKIGGGVNGTCVVGNRMYVADGASVAIYDITDKNNVALLGAVETPGSKVWDVHVVGNVLYVTDWAQATSQTTWGVGGLEAWDISDLSNIHMLSYKSLDNTSLAAGALPAGFTIRDNIAYVAEHGRGVVTYDISNPSNIKEMDVIASTPFLQQDGQSYVPMTNVADVAVNGSYLYASDISYGLIWVVGISNPKSMVFKNYFAYGSGVWGLEVSDSKLYAAGSSSGVMVYGSGAAPKLLGNMALPGAQNIRLTTATSGSTTKKFALVTTQDGTSMVDVTDPTAMGLFYVSQAGSAGLPPAANGSTAYLFSSAGGVGLDLASVMNNTSTKDLQFDAGPVHVHITIKGSGVIILPPLAQGQTLNPTTLDIYGASAKSSVTITTTGGDWSPDKITVHDYIGSFTATTTKADALSFVGIGTLKLGDQASGATIALGGTTSYPAASITLGDVSNLALTSGLNIKSLTVGSWVDNDATKDTFTALTVGKLTCTGEFDPDMTLTGGSATANTITSATIGGLVKGSTWTLTGNLGALTVKGNVQDWMATTPNATKVTLGAVSGLSRLTVAGTIGSLTAASWAASGQVLKAQLTAKVIKSLAITGDTAVDLTINGTAGALNLPKATIGSVSGGNWIVNGDAGSVGVGSIAGWTGSFDNVKTFAVKNNMTGTMTADSVATMSVGGNLSGSTVKMTTAPNLLYPKLLTLGKLTVGGAITNSTVRSAGHIGSVTVGAILGSTSCVTAGVNNALTHATVNPDFTAQARIDSLTIKGLPVAKGQPAATAFSGWVSAATLGKIKIANADRTINQTTYGITGKTMASYTYSDSLLVSTWTAHAPTEVWPTNVTFNSLEIDQVV